MTHNGLDKSKKDMYQGLFLLLIFVIFTCAFSAVTYASEKRINAINARLDTLQKALDNKALTK